MWFDVSFANSLENKPEFYMKEASGRISDSVKETLPHFVGQLWKLHLGWMVNEWCQQEIGGNYIS